MHCTWKLSFETALLIAMYSAYLKDKYEGHTLM